MLLFVDPRHPEARLPEGDQREQGLRAAAPPQDGHTPGPADHRVHSHQVGTLCMASNYNEDVVLMNRFQAPRGLPANSADPGRDPRHGHLQPARPRRQED